MTDAALVFRVAVGPGGYLQWEEADAMDQWTTPPTLAAREAVKILVREKMARGLMLKSVICPFPTFSSHVNSALCRSFMANYPRQQHAHAHPNNPTIPAPSPPPQHPAPPLNTQHAPLLPPLRLLMPLPASRVLHILDLQPRLCTHPSPENRRSGRRDRARVAGDWRTEEEGSGRCAEDGEGEEGVGKGGERGGGGGGDVGSAGGGSGVGCGGDVGCGAEGDIGWDGGGVDGGWAGGVGVR